MVVVVRIALVDGTADIRDWAGIRPGDALTVL
jgi:hypothetical protein